MRFPLRPNLLVAKGLKKENNMRKVFVVLGSGNSMFKGIKDRINLKLLKTRTFRSGNVLLYYEPGQK